MRFRPLIIAVAFVAFSLTSCRLIDRVLHDDIVVARVGKHCLYKSEVARLIQDGTSEEDSLRIAMQYITTWATDLVYLDIAESKLSKAEKDVSQELEAYRRALLKYRYEKLYVNERLDTSVTDDQIREYYDAHSADYVLDKPLVRAVFMRIDKDVADKKVIKAMMSAAGGDDEWEIESVSYSPAEKYTSYSGKWIELPRLAADLGMPYSSLANISAGNFVENTDISGKYNIAYISEMTPKGAQAPVEYCTDEIVDVILSARKHRLTTSLERDLLDDARDKGNFVIY